jgi:Tfp pilus assembly protein PilX
MKTEKNIADGSSRQGSILLVVLGMIMLMTLAGGIMAAMTNQSAFRARKTLNASRALSIAEAGVADILAVMNTN